MKGQGSLGDRAFPLSLARGSYDADYYVNNRIVPSVAEILESAGVDKEEFVKKTQKSILDF